MLPTLVTCTTHFIEARTTAQHVQLVTELYLYNSTDFNKLEVSRLDSTLSVFVFIFVQHILYHQPVERNFQETYLSVSLDFV